MTVLMFNGSAPHTSHAVALSCGTVFVCMDLDSSDCNCLLNVASQKVIDWDVALLALQSDQTVFLMLATFMLWVVGKKSTFTIGSVIQFFQFFFYLVDESGVLSNNRS